MVGTGRRRAGAHRRVFLDASSAHADAEAAQLAQQVRRQARANRILRAAAGTIAAALAVAVVLGVLAVRQGRRADQKADEARGLRPGPERGRRRERPPWTPTTPSSALLLAAAAQKLVPQQRHGVQPRRRGRRSSRADPHGHRPVRRLGRRDGGRGRPGRDGRDRRHTVRTFTAALIPDASYQAGDSHLDSRRGAGGSHAPGGRRGVRRPRIRWSSGCSIRSRSPSCPTQLAGRPHGRRGGGPGGERRRPLPRRELRARRHRQRDRGRSRPGLRPGVGPASPTSRSARRSTRRCHSPAWRSPTTAPRCSSATRWRATTLRPAGRSGSETRRGPARPTPMASVVAAFTEDGTAVELLNPDNGLVRTTLTGQTGASAGRLLLAGRHHPGGHVGRRAGGRVGHGYGPDPAPVRHRRRRRHGGLLLSGRDDPLRRQAVDPRGAGVGPERRSAVPLQDRRGPVGAVRERHGRGQSGCAPGSPAVAGVPTLPMPASACSTPARASRSSHP